MFFIDTGVNAAAVVIRPDSDFSLKINKVFWYIEGVIYFLLTIALVALTYSVSRAVSALFEQTKEKLA